MAILSFPKNPVCQSGVVPQVEHPTRTARQAFGSAARLFCIPALALLQSGLLLPTPTALAQTPATTAPVAPAPQGAGTAPQSAGAAPQGAGAAPQGAGSASAVASAVFTRPVAPASWTVTFKYGTVVAPQQAAHRANMVKVTVIGKDALETIQFPDRTAEVWRTEGTVITSEVGSEHAGVRVDQGLGNFAGAGGNSDLVSDVTRDKKGNFTANVNGVIITGNIAQEEPDWAEFKEFDWVTPDLFKGKIEISGEKLLVYADMEPEPPAPAAPAAGKGRAAAPPAAKFPPGPLGGLPLKPGIRVAAIEETTKTPRYLQMGENIQIYTFSKPQQAKLELPPKITNLVAKPAPPPEGAKAISLIP